MKQFYDHIKAKIEADLTDINTVRLWRNQYSSYNIDRMESVFRYPAIFIEFVPTEYFEYNQYRDVDLIVRFHVGIENYMIEKDEDLDLIDKIDRAFKGFRGNPDDGVYFTTFEKIVESDDPDDDNVNLIIVEYKTRFREIDSLPGDTIVVDPVTLDLDAEIVSEPSNPPFAVRCIAANNEYLSSPAGDYFGSTISGLDFSFKYTDIESTSTMYFIHQGLRDGANPYIQVKRFLSDRIEIEIVNNLLEQQDFQFDTNNWPISGEFSIIVNSGDLEIRLDGDLIYSETITINDDISGIASHPLYFSARDTIGIPTTFAGWTIDNITIKSHEWKSFNWRSPITTNSQGVQTTLHSDISTDAMIIEI